MSLDLGRVAQMTAAERVTAGLCPECGHRHLPDPDGCVGEPTASDLWAGVSVESCDCNY